MNHIVAMVILLLSPLWVWIIHEPRRVGQRIGMLAALILFPWYRSARDG